MAEINTLKFGHAELTFCSFRSPVTIRLGGIPAIRQMFGLRGNGHVQIGEFDLPVTPTGSQIIPADAEAMVKFGNNYQHLMLSIDEAAVRAKIELLTGVAPKPDQEIAPLARAHGLADQALQHLTMLLGRQFSQPLALTAPRALAEYEQSLILLFALECRDCVSDLPRSTDRPVAPWQVRLAEGYIEQHWAEPLRIEDLVEVTGASARSLFKTFQKSRGCSPMAFAKTVRLRNAHAILARSGPGVTIAGVGLMCGFQNLSYFAREYRALFNELPSTTLARAKGERNFPH